MGVMQQSITEKYLIDESVKIKIPDIILEHTRKNTIFGGCYFNCNGSFSSVCKTGKNTLIHRENSIQLRCIKATSMLQGVQL